MKSPGFYENYITQFCLEKKLFDRVYILRTMHGILPQVVEITI